MEKRESRCFVGLIGVLSLTSAEVFVYATVLYVFYFYLMYLFRLISLNKYKARFDQKISTLDLPFQKTKFMKCCKKLTGMSR